MPSQLQNRELPLRDTLAAASADTALGLTTAAGAYTKADEVVALPPGTSYVEVFFWGTNTANQAGVVNLYGWSDGSQNPPTYFLGDWTITLGSQLATVLPWGPALTSGLYVDTIAVKNADYWGCVIRDSAVNHVARLAFDTRGLGYLAAYFVTFTSTITMGAGFRAY